MKLGGGGVIISTAQIGDGVIVNADINASAAIAGSKLQALSVGANAGVIPSTGVADAHVSASAAIAGSKLQELSVGVNAGVIPSTGIVNAHIKSDAAIALSKLASDPLARANHTGTQLAATISDFSSAVSAIATTPEAKTIIPFPIVPLNPQATQMGVAEDLSSATTMYLGMVHIPYKITINKLSLRTGNMTGSMTIDINLYSEDGQTKTVLVADGAIDAGDDNVVKTLTVSSVVVNPGTYYLAFNIVDASGGVLHMWDTDVTIPFSSTAGLAEDVSSEPILQGTLTITSGTPPATINPTAITPADNKILIVRLDN